VRDVYFGFCGYEKEATTASRFINYHLSKLRIVGLPQKYFSYTHFLSQNQLFYPFPYIHPHVQSRTSTKEDPRQEKANTVEGFFV
jgi:hypothetical protein